MMVSRRDTMLALVATGAVTVQGRVKAALATDAQTHPPRPDSKRRPTA